MKNQKSDWAAEDMYFAFAAITRQLHGVVCRKVFHSEKAQSTAENWLEMPVIIGRTESNVDTSYIHEEFNANFQDNIALHSDL